MNRQVIRNIDRTRGATPATPDTLADRIVKMIPGEVVAAYLACNTALAQFQGNNTGYWVVFFIILGLFPFYLIRIMNVTDTVQIIIMAIAFILWCATIGKPFDQIFSKEKQQLYSTIALTLFTFAAPIFYKGK